LPHLDGEFLLLSSADADKFIPPSSSALLRELLPEPKTVMSLKGGHIGGRNSDLARRMVDTARTWLVARKKVLHSLVASSEPAMAGLCITTTSHMAPTLTKSLRKQR